MAFLQPKSVNPENTALSIRQGLVWAGSYLTSAEIPDPRLSAELLLGSVLGLDRPKIVVSLDQGLTQITWQSFQEKVFRRAQHEPIAYLIGQKEFWSLDFAVNPAVLIPRPETELLVEEALKTMAQWDEGKTLVELGTGSGAVSIALAKSIVPGKKIRILATDLSWPALQTARENASRHGVDNRIAFVQGNWLAPFSHNRRWIDLLVSNPPYISERDIFHLPLTIKGYEPIKALSGGPDGLTALGAILQQGSQQLKIGGRLILEIGESQGDRVLTLAAEHGYGNTLIGRDYSGKERILKASYHG